MYVNNVQTVLQEERFKGFNNFILSSCEVLLVCPVNLHTLKE
jgi:hypothetical protein